MILEVNDKVDFEVPQIPINDQEKFQKLDIFDIVLKLDQADKEVQKFSIRKNLGIFKILDKLFKVMKKQSEVMSKF